MPQPWTIEDKRTAGRTKVSVHENEGQQNGSAKDRDRSEKARHELPNDKNLAAHRRQEVVMQALFHDFAAKQPGKQPHAGEEDRAMQIELEDVSKHPGVFFKDGPVIQQSMDGDYEHRRQSQEVNPDAASHP